MMITSHSANDLVVDPLRDPSAACIGYPVQSLYRVETRDPQGCWLAPAYRYRSFKRGHRLLLRESDNRRYGQHRGPGGLCHCAWTGFGKRKPAPDLLARLDTAREYLKRYPETQLILTGGYADGSGRAEAAVMRDILTEHGVPEDRLILEYQAQTTKESFRNIAGIVSVEE